MIDGGIKAARAVLDIESVSARLGHADIVTTMSTYAHAFDAANRSDERRALLTALYGGNAMETTRRKRTKQIAAASGSNARKLRAASSSR